MVKKIQLGKATFRATSPALSGTNRAPRAPLCLESPAKDLQGV